MQNTEIVAASNFQSFKLQRGALLAKKIEAGMKKKQVNRQQFAGLMGVQPSIITRWLSGSHNFTVDTLFQIEDQLEIQLLAIEKPIYKEMHFHLVVGSDPAPLPHSTTSIVETLTGVLSSNVTYFGNKRPSDPNSCSNTDIYLQYFKYSE